MEQGFNQLYMSENVKPKVKIRATPNKVKGEYIYDVIIEGNRIGILRRSYKSEQSATGQDWIYIPDVNQHNVITFYSFTQASRSLQLYPPR